jgi:valyl-tRNA synthetase
LGNEQFLAKAPAQVIENMRKRVAELEILRGKTQGQLGELGS